MEIRIINNQQVWNNFFNENGSPSFLQSWEWGEFQEKMGYKTYRLGIYDGHQLAGIASTIVINSKRGKFFFIPHGPVIQIQKSKINPPAGGQNYIEIIKKYLINLAKKEKADFIRIAPVLTDNQENRKIFQELGFKTSPIYMHAERLLILPLNKSEEELLTAMRKTTRYLIKRASRDGVVVEKRTDEKAIKDFLKIYEETARRENFVPFSKKFIIEEFNNFNKTGNAVFLFAKIAGKSNYLAAALIIFTKSTAFYHQGASIHTKIPATYLIQWEAIREAKKRGCQFYNFWGIFQEGRTPQSWQGLTLFKQGFGGHQIDYVPTQDYILSPAYYLTWLYENFLKIKRGF